MKTLAPTSDWISLGAKLHIATRPQVPFPIILVAGLGVGKQGDVKSLFFSKFPPAQTFHKTVSWSKQRLGSNSAGQGTGCFKI
jgi:hypothetical protein